MTSAWPATRVRGVLDERFGHRGKVRTDLGGDVGEGVRGVVIQGDGRIVAAGETSWGQVGLTRYRPGGHLDRSFGSHGVVVTAVSPSTDEVGGLQLQADGRLVVAGTAAVAPQASASSCLATSQAELFSARASGSGVPERPVRCPDAASARHVPIGHPRRGCRDSRRRPEVDAARDRGVTEAHPGRPSAPHVEHRPGDDEDCTANSRGRFVCFVLGLEVCPRCAYSAHSCRPLNPSADTPFGVQLFSDSCQGGDGRSG